MRMTRDEFRLAVGLPLLAGVIAFLYGMYRVIAGPPAAAGALLPPTRIVAIGVAGIVARSRRGRPWLDRPARPGPARGAADG